MTSNQEGFTIVDEKLTYTNVVEELDEESILSEFVTAEELEAYLPEKKIHPAVVSKSEEVQEPASPNGSHLSIQPEELSESILVNLPASPSLYGESQVPEAITCEDAKDNVSGSQSVDKTTDDSVPEGPISDIESQSVKDEKSPVAISCLYSFIRLALLALLVSGGLRTRLQLSWSWPLSGEENNVNTTKSVVCDEIEILRETIEEVQSLEFYEMIALTQDHAGDLSTNNQMMAPLSIIPTLENPESGWNSLFTSVLALALSLCSVSFLTSKPPKEEVPSRKADRKNKSAVFQDTHAFLIECKKCLRRNGRRSRKVVGIEDYNITSYECLSIEDLGKILKFLNQPLKGSKQYIIKAIIAEYSKRLAFLTKEEISHLLALHDIHSVTKQKKAVMIKTLVEAAF